MQNYTDPQEIFEKYGSDALRFMMSSSSVMRGQELLIDKECKAIIEVTRLVLKPIWNSYNFFTLYANSDSIEAKLIKDSTNLNDKYILSKLKSSLKAIDESLGGYNLPSACDAVTDLFEVLNNWYIRRNRSRFWKKEKDQDKQEAYDTIYTVLYNIVIAASPLLPIIAEEIFLGLSGNKTSVHLCDYPGYEELPAYKDLVSETDKIREICTAALSIRNTHNVRIRQPLRCVTLVGDNLNNLVKYFDLIKDEVNIKDVEIISDVEKYAKYNLKIHFKELSKRLAHKMKGIITASKTGDWELVDGMIHISGEILEKAEFDLTLTSIDEKPSVSLNSGDALVMLDIEITSRLELEGIARDFVRIIQQARKTADFNISDMISVNIEISGKVRAAIEEFEEYVKDQTLAENLVYNLEKKYSVLEETHEIAGQEIKISLNRE